MPNLFSYGTLQNADVQLKLFGRTLHGAHDQLPGYKFETVIVTDKHFLNSGEDTDQKTIVPSGNKTDVVEGTILELSEQELITVDKYEPSNYHRVELYFSSGKLAWVFLVQE